MDVKFVNLNGVPTRIRTWGKKLDEEFNKKEIILFISGNPGITGFYITFLTTLFKFIRGQTPIYAIGQGGHDEPEDDSLNVPALRSNKHLYDLDGQVNHKVEFIRNYIPSDVKIHLVGHSIGACISLRLMKLDDINKRIHHCYLLFPTFEYMVDSPNGKRYVTWVKNIFNIIYSLLKVFSILPLQMRTIIVRVFCWIRSYPQEAVPYVLMFIRPSVMSKIVYMSDDEMEKIQEPDYAHIKQHEERLTFCYSTKDGWVPVSYYERLVSQMPNVKAHLTDKFEHSFVMKTSCEMGALLAEWLLQNPI